MEIFSSLIVIIIMKNISMINFRAENNGKELVTSNHVLILFPFYFGVEIIFISVYLQEQTILKVIYLHSQLLLWMYDINQIQIRRK